MGRVFARKFGVCGKTLPDYELSWLRILQHELATQVSLLWGPTPLKRGAFLVAYGPKRDRPEGGQALIRCSYKGFGLAPPVVLLLKGDDPGLARRMPKHGTTGNQPSARSTYGPNRIVAREDVFGPILRSKSHMASLKTVDRRVPSPAQGGME
jgi:hypothetical protein